MEEEGQNTKCAALRGYYNPHLTGGGQRNCSVTSVEVSGQGKGWCPQSPDVWQSLG